MCDTIEELNHNMKARFEVQNKLFGDRFDSLENALIIHAETPPAALSPLLSEIRNDIKEVKVQTTKTNGRVTKLEIWRGSIAGMSAATKAIFGVLSVFIIAACFALFNMYVEFHNLNNTIKNEVRDEIGLYGKIQQTQQIQSMDKN